MDSLPKDKAAYYLVERLRSELPLSEVGRTLAVMLYLRWADFQEAEAEAIAAFDGDDSFTPVLSSRLHWRTWYRFPPNELADLFSHELPSAIGSLAGSFSNYSLAASLVHLLDPIRSVGKLPPRALSTLTDWLEMQPFETPNDRFQLLDTFDEVFDLATDRGVGEFRTPADVNQLMVALAAPASGERIYDPCFGSAGLLTAACSYVRRNQESEPGFARQGAPNLKMVGVDINPYAFTIGLARLALAGGADAQLELGNSLEREAMSNPQKEGFDLVLCSPPWGGRIEPYGLHHFPIQTKDSTSLFIQHAMSQLRPDGRAVVVVPQGFLFGKGAAARVREWLVEQHCVEAVIDLSSKAFLPFSAVHTSILILRRDGRTGKRVRMVDGSAFFSKTAARSPMEMTAHEIETLVAATRDAVASKHTWDVETKLIAELDYDLSPVRRERDALLEVLDSFEEHLEVWPLGQLCEIRGGTNIPKAGLVDNPMFVKEAIPYIRIGNLERLQTGKAKSWLKKEAHELATDHRRLRIGEVLVSRSGTIGKVGVVRNGAVGGIATNGLVVLSPNTDKIDPHYLAAYIASADCNEWLQAKSGGAVIKGLRMEFIESLPVPLPALQIQQRIVEDVRNHQVDALTQLGLLLNDDDDDLLARWIDSSLRQLRESEGKQEKDPSTAVRFGVFGHEFRKVRNEVVHSDESNPLNSWVKLLEKLPDLFDNSENVPRGPGLFAILEQGAVQVLTAGLLIGGGTPIEGKAKELNQQCWNRLHDAINSLLDDVDVEIRLEKSKLLAGERVDLDLIARISGALPLNGFWIEAAAWNGSSLGIYFPEGIDLSVGMCVDVPGSPGTHMLELEWHGTGLDGKKRSGTQSIAVIVEADAETSEDVELGLSPYFISKPVGPERSDVFFGRETVVEQIKRQLQSNNVVLLEGNRRAGKSSILKHIEGSDTLPGWLVVYASFQSATGDDKKTGMPTVNVWRNLADSICEGMLPLGIEVPLPDGTTLAPGASLGIAKGCRRGISEESPWDDFKDFLRTVLKNLHSLDRGMVLMIDEFDKLQEGIDNGVTSPQIPENIRYLIQTEPRFNAVLTGMRRMQRLRQEYWSALYGLGNRIGVSSLDEASARKLVTEPVEGSLLYARAAEDLVVDLTACQPYLIQSLCNRIFDMALEDQQRSVSVPLVKRAASALVVENAHFATVWDYAEEDRRRYIVALCYREQDSPDSFSFGVLQERLAQTGIEVSDEDLDIDLKFLQELEVIEYAAQDSRNEYRLTVPLMGQWLARQDFEALHAKALAEQEKQL